MRLIHWDGVNMNCAGDELDIPHTNLVFAPYFSFCENEITFASYGLKDVDGSFGSASGFIP